MTDVPLMKCLCSDHIAPESPWYPAPIGLDRNTFFKHLSLVWAGHDPVRIWPNELWENMRRLG